MNLVEVAAAKPYRVRIGSGAVHELAGLVAGRRAAVVCPQTLVHLVPRFGIDDLVVIEVPDAEAAKTPEVLVDGWRRLAEASMTRGDIIVGFGGGEGLTSSTFRRLCWLWPTLQLAAKLVSTFLPGKTLLGLSMSPSASCATRTC